MKSINNKNLYLEFYGFLSAITFLTIIRLPTNNFLPMRSVKYFPIIGLLIGVLLYLIGMINLFITPFLQLLMLVVITGALHIDGLADTSDAIFSHKSLTDKLRIMKDSHIGSMGVISIFIVLTLKLIAFWHINNNVILIFIPFYSRFAMITAIYFLPYIRENSLNKEFFVNKNILIFLPSFFIIMVSFFFDAYFFYFFLLTIILALFHCYFFKKIIKGLTGDILGFICETTEATLLTIFALF